MKTAGSSQRRRVWDAPVRVFHWLLVASFLAAWLSRGPRSIDVHAAAGYAMAGLLLFRIAWGYFGSGPARFRNFVTGPATTLRYLRETFGGSAPEYLSHNPAGGWSVLALIALGLGVTLAGMALLSAQHGYGPFGGRLAAADAAALRRVHESAAWALVALVALHLAGVMWGTLNHDQDLIGAMITGSKNHVPEQAAPVPSHRALAAVLAATVCAGVAACLLTTGWAEGYATLRRQARAAAAAGQGAATATWRDECGACHLAYPPELLPLRSWLRMLDEQQRHFGEDLGLSADTQHALAAAARSGSRTPRWAGAMLVASIPAGEAPQRVTQTAFWRERHAAIAEARFATPPVSGRHDCGACHGDAADAIFSPRLIHMSE
jgi:cytochrome b